MNKLQSVLTFLGVALVIALLAFLIGGGIWGSQRGAQRNYKLMQQCLNQVSTGPGDRAGVLLCRYAIYGHH